MKRLLPSILCLCIVASTNSYAQLSNDECSGAMVVTSLPFTVSQNTRLATPNAADPQITCNDTAGLGKTVWFKYVADTTRNIFFSTIGSTPTADYDVMLGVYTGTCGSLTQVKCNDDANGVRQSESFLTVQSGTTYYILVGEWAGGGTSGGVPTGGDLVFKVFAGPVPIAIKGPKSGSLAGGIVVSTNSFTSLETSVTPQGGEREAAENRESKLWLAPKNGIQPTGPEGSNYFEDKIFMNRALATPASRPVQVKGFVGVPATNFLPPDPIMAVGPNQVIVMVNTTFRIYDKNGVLLKHITADAWESGIVPGLNHSDPQVLYDQYAKRWIMDWLVYPSSGNANYHTLSVSADSNAIGTWYQWKSDATLLGDSVTNGFGDYPALGYDSSAVYLVSRQFGGTTGPLMYGKLRIFKKSDLYANTAGPIAYTDFWDFRDLNVGQAVDNLRPTTSFTSSPFGYLMNVPPTSSANYITMWKITNPASTSPSISFDHVPVVQYSSPPDPDQLGGGTPKIDGGGKAIRANIVYRDSMLYAVHAVASGAGNTNSAVHYVRIDPAKSMAVEDVAFGLSGYFHTYPAISVDKNKSVLINFSRSNALEYVGAYATGRRVADDPGLSSSVPLREGVANYVLTGSGSRNRWGDYNGTGVDPSDPSVVWLHTEHVQGKNTWGTWTSKVVMGPVVGAVLIADRSLLSFGTKNVGVISPGDTLSVTFTNDGTDSVAISSVSTLTANFKLVNPQVFTSKIGSLKSITAKIAFIPLAGGNYTDSLVIMSNDVNNPKLVLKLTGSGFIIVKAAAGTMYATSGSSDGGRIYNVNTTTGTATVIGATGLSQITSLRVRPSTKEIIGLDPSGSSSCALSRISAEGQNTQVISTIPFANLKGITFLNDTTLYVGAFAGNIYRVNYNTGAATLVTPTSTGLRVGGLAINPKSGELWMSVRATSGILDAIYKVDVNTGTAKLVGQTGLGVATLDIAFDKNGKLYGLTGNSSQTIANKIITIDTTTGGAFTIKPTGTQSLQAIAFDPAELVSVGSFVAEKMPTQYSLEQNYPNPFNPTTSIRYSIPKQSHVTLKVYDAIGRVITTLVDDNRQTGNYKVEIDASRLASGVYYYELTAGSFHDIKKMMLLK